MTMSSDSDPPKVPQFVPQSLVSDLQSALLSRRPAATPPEATSDEPNSEEAKGGEASTASPAEEASGVGSSSADVAQDASETKPVVLVTCADGINSAGLEFLVTALVSTGQYDVSVCAPESGKFGLGDSITVGETIVATSTEVSGAKAFQVSGTPVDCVSLALSAALFSWSKPTVVISGINKGSSCGNESFHSGAVAGAKEALMCGIPAIAISLKWKNESLDTDFKDAVNVSMPLIQGAIRDVKNGQFPKSCFLNVGIPASPSTNKGVKITKQSEWRPVLSWQATSAKKLPSVAPQFISMHQSLGFQLAQLGRDASAAGAARRATAQKKNVEVESVAAAGKPENKEVVKKQFRLELVEKQQDEGLDGDLDYVALENGFISVTPLDVQLRMHPEIQGSASDWLASILKGDEEA
ncbi:5'-nucleotidase SurE [Rhynchospora pubera]|uniref:5'-nucleotidase SurE n=1 Tax=Rhynchospora pubera TaxID=906938 RepID=A0AAV8HXL2_9POAL|nr:5'-nucleotidase SurE [Rhynchospora pubera]